MTEQRHPNSSKSTIKAMTATDQYLAAREQLNQDTHALSVLQHRQASARLTKEEALDALVLQSAVEHGTREVEALRLPMQKEVQALDIADVISISNDLIEPHVKAFEQLIAAIAAVHEAKAEIIRVHNQHADLTNSIPSFRNLRITPPDGRETMMNVLSRLPDGDAWQRILMSPHSSALTRVHIDGMREVYGLAQRTKGSGQTRVILHAKL